MSNSNANSNLPFRAEISCIPDETIYHCELATGANDSQSTINPLWKFASNSKADAFIANPIIGDIAY